MCVSLYCSVHTVQLPLHIQVPVEAKLMDHKYLYHDAVITAPQALAAVPLASRCTNHWHMQDRSVSRTTSIHPVGRMLVHCQVWCTRLLINHVAIMPSTSHSSCKRGLFHHKSWLLAHNLPSARAVANLLASHLSLPLLRSCAPTAPQTTGL